MKKLLSVVLSVVLIVSCATAGFTSGVSAAGPVTVSTSVETQNGLTGGVITTNSSIAAQSGDSVTVSAKPYYGNGFEGWYDGATRVSTDADYTFTASQTVSLVAKFDIKNQIVDGDYEVGGTATADTYNAYINYYDSSRGTASISDIHIANSGAEYGSHSLMLIPNQITNNAKLKALLNTPVKVEQGKTYVWRFSYFSLAETLDSSKHCITFSIDKANSSGKPDWGRTVEYGFHSQRSSLEEYDASPWAGGNISGTTAYGNNNNFTSNTEWVDVFVIFTADTTGNYFLTLGSYAANMDAYIFDNMSFSETEKNGTPTIATATAGGSVSYYKGNEAAYACSVLRGQAVKDNTDFSNPYYQTIYQNYYAKANRGYIFDGWYKGNTKVSDNATLTAYALDGSYEAKFIADPNHYQITADVAEQDGRFGGYIASDKVFSDMLSGEEVKLTAVSYKGNTFEGWYEDGNKISSDASFTYYVSKDSNLTAKFNINNLFKDPGFENTAVSTGVWGATNEWYTVSPTSGMNGSVLGIDGFSGNHCINISCRNNYIAHKAMTVTANKVYSLSFAYRTSHKDATSGLAGVEVTNATTGAVIASDTTFVPSAEEGVWQKFDLCFNASTATSVIIKIKYTSSSDTTLYLDDITLFDTSKTPFIINASTNSEDGIYPGYLTCAPTQNASYGANVTVSVVGYERNVFKGWYDNGVLMSTSLTYTFSANAYRNLIAVFEKHNQMPDSGFENSPVGVDISAIENNTWYAHEPTRVWNSNLTVIKPTDAAQKAKQVHNGNQSLSVFHRNNTFKTKVTGLKPNTDYAFSFWWRNEIVSTASSLSSVVVKGLQTNKTIGSGVNQPSDAAMQQQIVSFNTGINTDIDIGITYTSTSGNCFIDDVSLYECCTVNVLSAAGGTSNSTLSGPCEQGESITVTATPDAGNTFLGWYDYKKPSICYSTNSTYTFTVDKSVYLISYFSGATAEPVNYFVDGGFENNLADPLSFSSRNFETNWCTFSVGNGNGSTITPKSGNNCLSMNAQSRNCYYIIDNLKPNTDYTLSFSWNGDKYVMMCGATVIPYFEEWSQNINQSNQNFIDNQQLSPGYMDTVAWSTGFMNFNQKSDEKWHDEQLTFNTENRTSVIMGWNYDREAGSGGLYMDDISITEGNSGYTDTLINGDFNAPSAADGWTGTQPRTESGNNFGYVASQASQNLTLEKCSGYTLKFKARSANAAQILYGLTYGGQDTLTTQNSMSNVSNKSVTLTADWKEYSLSCQTNPRSQYQLFLKSLNGADFEIDDVSIERAEGYIPVQKLTFEDSEYKFIGPGYINHIMKHNDEWFEYYHATSSTDNNVHSGEYSLLMKARANSSGHELTQSWAEVALKSGKSYKVTFWAKAATSGTKFRAASEYVDGSWKWQKFYDETLSLDSTDWTKFEITFTADQNIELCSRHRVTLEFDGVGDGTTSDIYFDDIDISLIPNIVYDKNASLLYTENISTNYFPNYSFEKSDALTDGYTLSGGAAFGDRYVHVNAGDKIVVPVTTRTDYNLAFAVEYTFAASVRGNAASAGKVGLASDPSGNIMLKDTDGNDVSLGLNTVGEWERSGYTFYDYRNSTLYLVIDCTAGGFDVDYLALFTTQHAYESERYIKADPTPVVDEDMGIYDVKGTYISGKITGLPTGSSVVIKSASKALKSTVAADGSYEIIQIPDGNYTMYVVAGGYPFATAYGDLNISDDKFSGLACKRLSGAAIHVSGNECKSGIVKILDEDTGYAYFTTTSNSGVFNSYILDSTWDVEGSTNDADTISSYSLNLSDFGNVALISTGGSGNPGTGDSTPFAAMMTVMITSLAVLAFAKKKGVND